SGNKICGMSMIATSLIIQTLTYRTTELIEESDKIAPIYKSQNIDGGRAFNENLELPYKERLSRT
ncbi:MAG: hypothetical protein JXK92_10340, partial [Erysipelotrichaceae bacterium]|nr:hypothetical protein [Erysipelotrichaceae bacterium]